MVTASSEKSARIAVRPSALKKDVLFATFAVLPNVDSPNYVMLIDKKPFFRKVIVPWYDSETACLTLIVFMFLVCLFGFAGISAARENVEYNQYIWIAVLLVVLSGVVIISTTIRLIKRFTSRHSK